MGQDKIVLIDGHSIMHRAFYGVPDLTNSEGTHTNAVYGFLNILLKILDEEQPGYLAVAFDLHAPTFRHQMYAAYKGTRKPMPPELKEQMPLIQEMLSAMRIPIYTKEGYEADDILGTLSRECEEQGLEVSVLSGDRDLLQLASDRTRIRIPKTKRTGTEIEDYYAADVQKTYQVTPSEFIDLKALMGDASDNIPGVRGIGEKTATGIIVKFHSIENAYAHVEEVTPPRARENLKTDYEQAVMSKTLATIDRHAPLQFALSDAAIGDLFTEEAYLLCKKLELKTLLSRFDGNPMDNAPGEAFSVADGEAEQEKVFAALDAEDTFGFYVVSGKEGLLGISFAWQDQAVFLPADGAAAADQLLARADRLFAREGICAVAHGLKEQLRFLKERRPDHFFDTRIAYYLLNPLKNEYPYEDLGKDYADRMVPSASDLLGKLPPEKAKTEKPAEFLRAACYPAFLALKSKDRLLAALREKGMEQLFFEIEMPLSVTLFDMEQIGIRMDSRILEAYSAELAVRIGELEQKIYAAAGETFNINSPKQLGEILFERLSLPNGKKTKTGYSTAADVLEKLAPDHPIVSDILEYRALAKLKSTYADGLPAFVAEDGRIHSTFHQTVTATGRISSADPNLQNIPIRTDLGRQIRKAFLPAEGFVFLDADYSQIELRVLAHLSGDEHLIEAYRSAQDIHRMTASQVFHVPFEEVTPLQRRNAKAVNFGIVYGISSFGLSQDLSISRKEAQEYIERYFEVYPVMHRYLQDLVTHAKEEGVVRTMFGRIRPVPELSSSNFMQRQFGERVAMNSPIQGTAADIIKIAMIRVHDRLAAEGLRSRLVVQVHDELLIETAVEETETVKRILAEEMEHAAELSVPLEIDMHEGEDWYSAK
ncbi:MAG: DNA polymerase I [Lachnospiraceae bacterium]|nr:DNA polymerase I [Lachnospiraceae bacterium]